MTAVRTCPSCRQQRPETDFYLQVRGGYKPTQMGTCKACHEARVRRRMVNRQEQKKRVRLP